MESMKLVYELSAVSSRVKTSKFLIHFFSNFHPLDSKCYNITLSHFSIPHLEASDYRSAYHQLCDWLYGWNVSDTNQFSTSTDPTDLLNSTKRVPRQIDIKDDAEIVECERILATFQTLFYFSQRQLQKQHHIVESKILLIGQGIRSSDTRKNTAIPRNRNNGGVGGNNNNNNQSLQEYENETEMDRVWRNKKSKMSGRNNSNNNGKNYDEDGEHNNGDDDNQSIDSSDSLDIAVETLLKKSNKGYTVKAAGEANKKAEPVKDPRDELGSLEYVPPPDIVVKSQSAEEREQAERERKQQALFDDGEEQENEGKQLTKDEDGNSIATADENDTNNSELDSNNKTKATKENNVDDDDDGNSGEKNEIPVVEMPEQSTVIKTLVGVQQQNSGNGFNFMRPATTIGAGSTGATGATTGGGGNGNEDSTLLGENDQNNNGYDNQDKQEEKLKLMQTDIHYLFNELDKVTDYTLLCMVNSVVVLGFSEILDHKEIYQKQISQVNALSADFISSTLKTIYDLLGKLFPNDIVSSGEVRDLTALRARIKQMIWLFSGEEQKIVAAAASNTTANNNATLGINTGLVVNPKKYRYGKIYRKFEFLHELFGACDIHVFPRFVQAHKEGTKSCAYSEFDSALWLSGGYDGIIRIHDLRPGIHTGIDGTPLAQFVGHKSIISEVHFAKKDTAIVSCSFDRTLKIWGSQTGTCEKTLLGHTDSVTTCHITRDSRYIASGSVDCTVRFWDLTTGDCLTVIKKHTRWVKVVRFSWDGRYLASAGLDRRIYIWDTKILLNSKNITHTRCIEAHNDSVLDLAMTKHGILITTSRDSQVKVFDFVNGHEWHSIDLTPSWACTVSSSEDGEFFATGSFDNSINLFKVKTGEHLRHIRVFNLGILCVRFPIDLEYLVVGGNEGYLQQIKL